MKVPILDRSSKETGKLELPEQFDEEIRPDIIKRAVIAIQNHQRQPYGAFPMAGKQASAVVSRRRRDYRGSYGLGISRVPRKVMSRSGTRMNWVGAFAPGMVGGRRAHPPKVTKSYDLKVNKKERRKAIRSALAATMHKSTVVQRGHIVPENFPFVIDSGFEDISKAKDLAAAIQSLGFEQEYARNSQVKVRAGRGKSRGRKYKKHRGMLIVVSKDCHLLRNCGNLPGVEIAVINSISAEMLAPGTNPGRLTLFTKSAVERLSGEKLFTDSQIAMPAQKTSKVKEGKSMQNSPKKTAVPIQKKQKTPEQEKKQVTSAKPKKKSE